MSSSTLLCVVSAAVLLPGGVWAQERSIGSQEDDFLIGASVVSGNAHVGTPQGSTTDLKPLWAFQLGPLRVSRSRASALMSVGREALETGLSTEFKATENVSLSASLRLDNGRSFDSDPLLRGLPDIGTTVRARLSARRALGPRWSWSMNTDHDLLGRKGGLRLGTGVNYAYPYSDDTQWDFSLGTGLGNARYMQTHYGISLKGAQATGRDTYQLSGGLENLRTGINFSTALGDRWVAFGGLEMSRILGRAARSPLVGRLATHSVTIGIAYRSR
ncbi:MAG: MipA/OmpV family protein [Hydrogenophaga sp.]|uniref:MipA/OmpV family protein n=1 Tax=Hydrogenophaga sp. TaxID=1904254 RepID=UPI0027F2324F|nr:MipA/OmpV family protein [Hydrogenophaga sp.]